MGRYYNKTRAPLPATLRDGSAISLPARQWLTIRPDQDGSGPLKQLVKKGLLAYRPDSPAPAPVAVPPKPKPAAPTPPAPPKKPRLVAPVEPARKPSPPPPPPEPEPVPEPVVEEKPVEPETPAIEVTSSVEITEDESAFDLPSEVAEPTKEDLPVASSSDLKSTIESTPEQTEITEPAIDVSTAEGEESVASENDSGSESTPRPKKTRRRKRRS